MKIGTPRHDVPMIRHRSRSAGTVSTVSSGLSVSGLSIVCALLVTSVLFAPVAQAQFKEITRLGTSESLCKGGVTSADGLKAWFLANRSDVEQVLADAGAAGMGDAVLSAIESGNVEEKTVKAGTEFLWMGRRKKGQPIAQPRVRYMGKKEEPAFGITVTQNCQTHELLIPAICCNLSLISSSPVPPPGMPSLDVIPPDSCDGGVVDIRAVGEADSNLDVVLVGPDGQERTLSAGELNGNLNVSGAGSYSVKAGASNACGESTDRTVAMFEVEACPAEVTKAAEPPKEVKPAILPFLAGFVGMQRRSRDLCDCFDDLSEGLVGGRAGVMYPINDRLHAFGQLGAAIDTEDSAYSLLQADIGLETRIGEKGFFGGGVGIWDINSSLYRDPTIFIHGGVDTPWKLGGNTLQWFIEGRKWLDEPFEEETYLDDDYSALTGLRLMYGR